MAVRSRLTLALTILVAVAGCRQAPEQDEETRPVWRGATIDGIAPLMSVPQVKAALDRAGYRQIQCVSDRPLLDDPFNAGVEMPCFKSPTRPMQVSLYFLDLVEGRRLVGVNFRRFAGSSRSDEEEVAAGRKVLRWLTARFGPPPITMPSKMEFTSYYWKVPSGKNDLPDTINTTVGRTFGANVAMTSMWAYGHEKPSGASPAIAEPPPPPRP